MPVRHPTITSYFVAAWLGCGGAAALPATAEPPPAPSLPDDLPLDPATQDEPQQPSSSRVPVASPAMEPVAPPKDDWSHRLIGPDAVTRPDAPALVLHGRRFEGSSRFEIEQVPLGVTVHRVGDAPPTWEFRDAEGRRLALLQEEQWRHVMHPRLHSPKTAPFWAESAGTAGLIRDWGGAPARVRCEQLLTPLRLYRIERLEKGTDFLVMGFIYKDTVYVP